MEEVEVEKPGPTIQDTRGFVVSHQKVDLSFDFPSRSIIGVTNITILPQRGDLRTLRFDAQQLDIPEFSAIKINGKDVEEFMYDDGFEKLDLLDGVKWDVHQHELQKDRIEPLLKTKPALGALDITIPSWIKIEDVNPFAENAPTAVKERIINTGGMRTSSVGPNRASTPLASQRVTEDANLRFAPLQVEIKFQCVNSNWREGLQWIGMDVGDKRYPHVYSRHALHPGTASCIFPCIDDPAMRSTWEIVIRCGKTLGDALKPQAPEKLRHQRPGYAAPKPKTNGSYTLEDTNLAMEDKQLEMAVICSADLTSEAPDPSDSSRKIVSFICANQVAARHIGFAVGPFETADLSDMRDSSDDEKLGQKAIQVVGYCLPGRVESVRNICGTLPSAVDWFSLSFGSYPFSDYKVCFVDDQLPDTQPLASLSLCSTRLLIPEDVIDPEIEFTHKLVHALASQWMGVNIIEASRCDMWAVVGVSHFMTEVFMKHLCGNNEYRFRQKTLSDKLVELDIDRPSLYALGETLHLGRFELSFMELKAPLVMFILDRRLVKASGSSGLSRIISRFFFTASTGEQLSDKAISTDSFKRLCEKVGHYKVDAFFNQYVLGAGCPRFSVTQKFNKKRLAVEMTITQKQDPGQLQPDAMPVRRKLEKDAFLREFKEETNGIYAGEQQVFTGPMTIRIHEADGTPYEHIVEIREAVQKIEIPYHTKYKRLKRSRREKEKATAGVGLEMNGDNENDVLLYCLGDVLQTKEEMMEWGLVEWDEEVMLKMEQESYEWIRMDADFEWLAELTINMPAYMYVSQLQQDRDVVAQQDSMLYLSKSPPHPLVSTILVRTLMDRRYFHGIRTLAANYLPKHATESMNWIGRRHLEKTFQHFFCHSDSQSMPRANDFSDKKSYLIQCAIPQAMSRIRNDAGKSPREVRRFILDQLSFNDNHNNEYSDHFYVANLMKALAGALLPTKTSQPGEIGFSFESEDEDELRTFIATACEEIDRYRRMDEWDPTYQNIYTTTALTCKQQLMAANVIPKEPMEFLRYAHDDCLDVVRIKALGALVHLGYFNADHFMQYFMLALSTDNSPFVRERLSAVFGLGLAGIAFGESSQIEAPVPMPEDDGLIIEEDANLDLKKAQIARTTTIEGALAALKEELKDNLVFKTALWASIGSRKINPWEQSHLLDICYVLFDPIESMTVALKYPRYWKVEKVPKMRGHIIFRRTPKLRLKMKNPPKIKIEARPPQALSAPTPSTTSTIVVAPPKPSPRSTPVPSLPPTALPARPTQSQTPAAASGLMRPPKRPSPPSRTATSDRPSKMIKLTLSKSVLSHYPQGLWGAKAPPSGSPAPSVPKMSPSPSPIPPSQLGGAASPSSNGAPKIRVPLPSGKADGAARIPLPSGRSPLVSSAPATPSPPIPGDVVRKPSLKLKFSFGKKSSAGASASPPPP